MIPTGYEDQNRKQLETMKNQPTFSIIIATYNVRNEIQQTLNSIVNQTNKDFEVIVIDNNSIDGTLEDIANFPCLNIRILSESDSGIADAWNKGIKASFGKWVIFLNAGDSIPATHLQRASETLKDCQNNSILFCNVSVVDVKNQLIRNIFGNQPSARKIKRGFLGFAHPGSFTGREVFQIVGDFNTSYKIAIDSDFLMRHFKLGGNFIKFNSTALMASGGVSDLQFKEGIAEHFYAAVNHGIVSPFAGKIISCLLPPLRTCLKLTRNYSIHPMRFIKHFLVSLLNTFGDALILYSLRRVFFGLLQFKLGCMSSIGLGFKFYGLGNIVLGNNTVINRDCLFDNRALIKIGENVSISRSVQIYTGGHNIKSEFFELTLSDVSIGDYAVIFSRVTILPGVKIGKGAVVYPGSVVSKDVHDFEIVGGNPASKIGVRKLSAIKYKLHYPYPMAM
jgi:acetyltransferase-like isoleucine patch superfamily enzyme